MEICLSLTNASDTALCTEKRQVNEKEEEKNGTLRIVEIDYDYPTEKEGKRKRKNYNKSEMEKREKNKRISSNPHQKLQNIDIRIKKYERTVEHLLNIITNQITPCSHRSLSLSLRFFRLIFVPFIPHSTSIRWLSTSTYCVTITISKKNYDCINYDNVPF